jgi:hypothetical protein
MRSFGVAPLIVGLAILTYGASASIQTPAPDPVARLARRIQSGGSNLAFEAKHGYLKSVLKELGIPISSQTLVWSKTSLQGPRIGPRNPRAIYFNDHTYVGWVNGGEFIEIGSIHPTDGTQFYTIRNVLQPKVAVDKEFDRCISCHAGPGMGGSPRLLARSVNADKLGYQLMSGGRIVTPRTPIEQRWGGWYVSGTHGKIRHRGNSPAVGDDESFTFDPEIGANKTDLSRYFDTGQYLSPHSDIVALMVLESQMHLQNEIIRTGSSVRRWLLDPDSTLASACEPLVEALLGVGEAPLKEPIKGMGTFQREYESGGIKDAKGRSLRELDLKTRLYKHRLNPMILSESFSALNPVAKKQVLARLAEIAEGTYASERFSFLKESDRTALKDVLSSFKLVQ